MNNKVLDIKFILSILRIYLLLTACVNTKNQMLTRIQLNSNSKRVNVIVLQIDNELIYLK